MRRQAFDDIASGWMLVHDVGALTEKIEELAAWTEANGPLTDDEMATVKLMIETQIAWGFEEAGFFEFGERPASSFAPSSGD